MYLYRFEAKRQHTLYGQVWIEGVQNNGIENTQELDVEFISKQRKRKTYEYIGTGVWIQGIRKGAQELTLCIHETLTQGSTR